MQTKTRRTEITVETETLVRVRRIAGEQRGHCAVCGAERPMLTPVAAALISGRSTREIYRALESGVLHFDESSGDTPLICRDSLLAHLVAEQGPSR